MTQGRLSGEVELQMLEHAHAEVASRRRWKRLLKSELYGVGVLAAVWVGWITWGWLFD